MRFLITAGPTHEPLDPVRFLGNHSSGKLGFALARAAATAGHEVVLVHGPVCLRPPRELTEVVAITTAAELHRACMDRFEPADVIIMAAAVADFTPRRLSRRKLARTRAGLSLELTPTRDVCAALGRRKTKGQVLVGFALESDDPEHERARRKRTKKRCDLMAANTPATLGSDRAELVLLGKEGEVARLSGTKPAVARRLIVILEEEAARCASGSRS